jgi:hypothetical protein
MTDLTPFEQRLSERLTRELDRGGLTFDADRIATAAMAQRRPLDRVLNRLALGPLPMATARKAVLVAVAALLALVTVALAFGTLGPGGSRLAFIRMNGEVVIANGDGSGQSAIYQVESPVLFTQFALAPDGEHLALVDESFQLAIIDRTGQVTHSRTMDTGFNRFDWSPDGRQLAILDGPWLPREPLDSDAPMIHPDLEVIGLDGDVEWTVSLPPDFRYSIGQGELAWSPEGRWIAFTGTVDTRERQFHPSSPWIVDVNVRTAREFPTGEPLEHHHGLAWLPNGSLVYSRFNSGIWQIDPSTGASRTIFEMPCAPRCGQENFNVIEPSPDGSSLLIDDPAQGLSILDLATGVSTALQPDVAGILPSLRWTADGKSLLVSYPATPRDMPFLAAFDLATGEQRVLVEGVQFFDYVP